MKKFNGIFIKIGQFEHLKLLQNEGLIHCETLQYFANLKDEHGKGDKFENVLEMEYYENATMDFLFENPNRVFSFDISGSYKHRRVTSHCGNLFCLYSVNFNDLPSDQIQKFIIDQKLGTHALIFKSELFFRRLEIALNTLNCDYSADFVEYIDFSKYSGKKTFFQKDIAFSKQLEYRILIDYPHNKALQIRIGNIQAISDLISVEELQ